MERFETFGDRGGLTAHMDPACQTEGCPGEEVAMVFNLVAMMVWDEGIVEIFRSPFVIPVAGCVMILGMSVASMWAKVRSEEIKSHERLARIAQGLPVEPLSQEPVAGPAMDAVFGAARPASTPNPGASRPNDGSKARRAGIVLTSIGLGLFFFFAALAIVVRVREVMSGGVAGLIPLAIGIGFLIDARLKRRDYERHLDRFGVGSGAGMGAGLGMGGDAGLGSVPPPPPVGMTPAQASDWQPRQG